MEIIKIKSKRQSNNLWGYPMALVYVDSVCWKNDVLRNAIITAISEKYPGRRFEIHFTSERGFNIKMQGVGWMRFNFRDYRLVGKTLIYAKNISS